MIKADEVVTKRYALTCDICDIAIVTSTKNEDVLDWDRARVEITPPKEWLKPFYEWDVCEQCLDRVRAAVFEAIGNERRRIRRQGVGSEQG